LRQRRAPRLAGVERRLILVIVAIQMTVPGNFPDTNAVTSRRVTATVSTGVRRDMSKRIW
jgi:hypothetical protein